MINFLKSIDIYGTQFSLNIEGKSKHKTVFGGLSTILSSILLVLVVILFGNDFFFRLNPKIISQRAVNKASELVVPTTSTFPIAFRVEDFSSNVVNLSEKGVKLTVVYRYFTFDDQGASSIKHVHNFELKMCSTIPAVQTNEVDQSYNLQQYYCIDWDEVTDFTPFLGGYWGEDKVGYITLQLNNCNKRGAEDCASLKEMRKIMENEIWYFSVVYPNYFFDTESFDNPIKTYFDTNPYEVSPYTRIVQDARMQVATLTDDKGWIFKDESVYTATSLEYIQTTFSSIIDDDVGNFRVFEYSLYFGKVSTKISRSFVKIQELAAEVGGIVKLLHLVFSFLVGYYSKFDMTRSLVTKTARDSTQISRLSESNIVINAVQDRENKKPHSQISFWNYCFKLFYKAKSVEFKGSARKIEKHFEVYSLLQLFKKLERMNVTR